MLLEDAPVIEYADVVAVVTGQVGLLEQGISPDAFAGHLGVNPVDLARACRESADHAFARLHPGAGGAAHVRNLTATQRTAVHDTLATTARVYLQAGMVLAYTRAGILGQEDAPGDTP